MKVIWDPAKAKINLIKHRVRLSDADVALFDPFAVTREDVSSEGEHRFVAIGSDASGKVVVVIFATHGEIVRLISSRKATKKERNTMRKEYDFSKGVRGPVIPQPGKTRITIYIDNDIIEEFRDRSDSLGRGYQTMINDALREFLGKGRQAVDARTLRKILREELRNTG